MSVTSAVVVVDSHFVETISLATIDDAFFTSSKQGSSLAATPVVVSDILNVARYFSMTDTSTANMYLKTQLMLHKDISLAVLHYLLLQMFRS